MNPTHHRQTTLALLALASLTLTGCGTTKTEDAATQNSPAATSTVASTASADSGQDDDAAASPSASASDPEASSEASDSEDKYSGGSKAPAGEYRAADEHGPAQNVPKPKEPEGMNVESTEGMEKFIHYWNELRDYALETGDTSDVRKYVSTNYEEDIHNYDTWDHLYDAGGWVYGGNSEARPDMGMTISHGDGFYSVPINYIQDDMAFILDDQVKTVNMEGEDKRGYELKLQYADDGNWYVIGQEVVGQ